MMLSDLIEKYDYPVPRYTSYPTAVQFSPAVGAASYEGWLADAPTEKPISLYLHVPFCRTLCFYCGCHTKALGDNYNPVGPFLSALLSEIAFAGKRLGRRQAVFHIHFGGGTPTFLRIPDMETVFDALRQTFDIRQGAEIAIEIDPRMITEDQAQALAALGISRVSLGVQDFDPAVQEAIGRIQPYEEVVKVTEWFRAAGIKEINFDMMYGLPRQTAENIADNARKVAALRPGRMALFGYAHVPWMKKNQTVLEKYAMPGTQARYEQFAASRNIWLAEGYREIGIDHFALPEDALFLAKEAGTMRRNFMGYTADAAETIIGLGPSAISMFAGGYAQNSPDTKTWQEKLARGESPAMRGLVLTPADIERRAVIEALMCYGKAAIGALDPPPLLYDMQRDGLVGIAGDIVTITEAGRPFTRVVCAAFDEYFEKKKPQRHARAV